MIYVSLFGQKVAPGLLQIFVPRYCSGAAKGACRLSSISASSGLQSLDETHRRLDGIFRRFFSRENAKGKRMGFLLGGSEFVVFVFSYDELMGVIYSSWKTLRVEVVMDWHGMKGELWFLKRRDWPTILSKAWTSTSSFPFIYNMIRCGFSTPNGWIFMYKTPSVLPMYDQYP